VAEPRSAWPPWGGPFPRPIAHEIRQPLTAMAGAVQGAGRVSYRSKKTKKHLCQYCEQGIRAASTISSPTFSTILEEKTYEFFSMRMFRGLLDETLLLMEGNRR